jgi:hypothetical protein
VLFGTLLLCGCNLLQIRFNLLKILLLNLHENKTSKHLHLLSAAGCCWLQLASGKNAEMVVGSTS